MFRRHVPAEEPSRELDPDRELNFARTILQDRTFREVPDDEVLREAERLLFGWMTNETKLERPKLYDHYALVFLALIRKNRELEERIAALEAARE
ncbi:hypothetical protein [Deinococcus radiodurans]|jgi:hypothetical protein|uniref:Uncharacterized protein n=1 Tax=Deinococcus radiodurans (strain ATCC 13939 / DSM 20539 / JCM 16871 / CCUG 27074 / LMG 4051 / NBRC 15346 / NCIMB 9279 / VKM B-1422 / R1) TaxID=243230 RepID=Q9RY27_DEIRA|nr:hypothetical protein [Deinococcus radiodurans]AAF09721.1 hypothetical protein DR_0124 [Deinococcus radiodurans R1 = ATCC 13939 = DSM 20539]ANC72589.1 hypothetical protein A2G07_12895 [Deinococcus radiodurans R1 = ATCC 13939 = DSM 20539]QEM72096.1 hypothetical protein DXG80_10240 [Deinococcus radiodurans]QIP28368.1 hypothetical protein HAV23_03510 [Deinococcus radiodurans]QIP30759.1 hypothetical protein HAV35_00010 [Deinococcus radiodurans]